MNGYSDSTSYEVRKKMLFREISGYAVKVTSEMMRTRDPVTDSTDGEKIVNSFKTYLGKIKDSLPTVGDIVWAQRAALATGIGIGPVLPLPPLVTAFVMMYAISNTGDEAADKLTQVNAIIEGVDTSTILNIMYATEKFYNRNLDSALSRGYDKATFEGSLDVLRDDLYTTFAKGTTLSGSIQEVFNELSDVLAVEIAERLGRFDLSAIKSTISYLPPETNKSWEDIANNLKGWNDYFKYSGDKFGLINPKGLYKGGANYSKSVVRIDSVIDIGVASISRYDHLRMHNGGELGSFFGNVDNKPEAWDPLFANGKIESPLTAIDGHGFVDGTCNFFMLAQITMDGASAKAVLWLDEQEYFSERWRVLHPRDAAFEGLPATLSSAFPASAWFNGERMNEFDGKYWTPYQTLAPNARMANSRYAIIIADEDRIYSTSFFWAITDRTWRWRYYPRYPQMDPAKGDFVDKTSIGIRDDQTIYLKGRKVVGVDTIDGFWYQRVLGADNTKQGALKNEYGLPARPDDGYIHLWNFLSSEAFAAADKNYFRMGMYENTDTSTTPEQHYAYKGYTPRTHVFKIDESADIVWSAFTLGAGGNSGTTSPADFTVSTTAAQVFKDSSHTLVPVYHPMYSTMKTQFKKPVTVKFVKVGQELFAVFADPRNDDCKLWNNMKPASSEKEFQTVQEKFLPYPYQKNPAIPDPLPVTTCDTIVTDSSIVVTTITTTIDTIKKFGGSSRGNTVKWYERIRVLSLVHTTIFPNLFFEERAAVNWLMQSWRSIRINTRHLSDLNVWADLQLSNVSVAYNEATSTISCSFDLPTANNNMRLYRLRNLKIGYIENGAADTLCTAAIFADSTTSQITVSVPDVTIAEWDKYFSESGRINHGTSIWIEDAFGNGNVFESMSVPK